jgi:hypothetical protein
MVETGKDNQSTAGHAQTCDIQRAEVVFRAGIDSVVAGLQAAKPEYAPLIALIGEPCNIRPRGRPLTGRHFGG